MLRNEMIQSFEGLHQQRLRKPLSELRRWGRFWRVIDIGLRVCSAFSALVLLLIELITGLVEINLQTPSSVGFVLQSLLLHIFPLFILITACATSFFLAFFSYNDESDDPFPVRVLSMTIGISLVDNGLITNAFLFSDLNIHPIDHFFYYIGLLLVSAIYAGLSRLLLRWAVGML